MTDLEGAVERAAAILKAWNRRETDLLEANNRYLERARAAEAERDAMKEGLKPFADFADLMSEETEGFSDDDHIALVAVPDTGAVEMDRKPLSDFRRAATLVNGEGG